VDVLPDQSCNRWCRQLAAAGRTTFTYSDMIHCPDRGDPVWPAAPQGPVLIGQHQREGFALTTAASKHSPSTV
jgi:hypothetical protein